MLYSYMQLSGLPTQAVLTTAVGYLDCQLIEGYLGLLEKITAISSLCISNLHRNTSLFLDNFALGLETPTAATVGLVHFKEELWCLMKACLDCSAKFGMLQGPTMAFSRDIILRKQWSHI